MLAVPLIVDGVCTDPRQTAGCVTRGIVYTHKGGVKVSGLKPVICFPSHAMPEILKGSGLYIRNGNAGMTALIKKNISAIFGERLPVSVPHSMTKVSRIAPRKP